MASNVIAIDGPAASGKSTLAKNLASRLGIVYINTGSLYRAIAWKAAKNNIPFKDAALLEKMLDSTTIVYSRETPSSAPDICIDGVYPKQELRTAEIAKGASDVATVPVVRSKTLEIQRDAAKEGMVVMEGRDIGTVVFPDAKYKFFLTATPLARAMRRLAQDGEAPDGATLESMASEIAERDRQDSMRSVAPLKQADDAILVDSSKLMPEETLEKIISYLE